MMGAISVDEKFEVYAKPPSGAEGVLKFARLEHEVVFCQGIEAKVPSSRGLPPSRLDVHLVGMQTGRRVTVDLVAEMALLWFEVGNFYSVA